eukprot:4137320-Pleurochrysis_carterae.AAC.2
MHGSKHARRFRQKALANSALDGISGRGASVQSIQRFALLTPAAAPVVEDAKKESSRVQQRQQHVGQQHVPPGADNATEDHDVGIWHQDAGVARALARAISGSLCTDQLLPGSLLEAEGPNITAKPHHKKTSAARLSVHMPGLTAHATGPPTGQ